MDKLAQKQQQTKNSKFPKQYFEKLFILFIYTF